MNRSPTETEANTVAHYLDLAREMSEDDFVATLPHPVFIEKLGVFPHETSSLLSGTLLVTNAADFGELGAEYVDDDILAAKVFPVCKKPGSMGPDIFVGRAPTNDIILPSSSVSKSHAQISPLPDSRDYRIADMFSSNGTILNGEKIHPFEKHQLHDRDQISLGPDYLLIYYSASAFYQLLRSLII